MIRTLPSLFIHIHMPHAFDQSKNEVARLVKHFLANRAAYLSPSYKEAHARQEFIDPLFSALNWDVQNRQLAAPDYREVIVEDSVDIEGQKRAPDYAFRVGRDRKFFAEAKKPGVDVKMTVGPAYQLRRYAWSAKLPLSILTDFEEFAVYDCRIRPGAKDKATVARINYLTCEELPDRWKEVWDVFSRDAVWSGSFDQFARGGKGRKGSSEVDAEFLKEIEGWRDVLARNLALRNPKLTIDELNDAVQRTIDRIIFLRMAEDRGVEEYGRLQQLAGKEDIYPALLKICREADAKYNSGLFDFSKSGDRVTPGLNVDDKTLRSILADLYYPQSPYEFSVMPAEILGNVYEQFLGKVIRLTAGHQAKVEEKPEVKKAGGVFYTPSYIVEYIVKNTVGKQLEGKTPGQLRGFRVLDPACGSGSFLLGAYTFLLNWYLDWYVANNPAKHADAVVQGERGGWELTLQERKHILTEHIFGVDIDRQAVEVTKLSLLLKVLEGVRQLNLFAERALPHLDANIKCGNSLIGPDYFSGQLLPDPEELRRVNPFDWKAEFPEAMKRGGFDCVIGNPPYIRIQTMNEWAPLEVEAYKTLYKSAAAGNYDIYVVFVERAIELVNERGHVGFILPNKFFTAKYGAAVRKLICSGSYLDGVVHFGDQQVFIGATTYTCLLFLAKGGRREFGFQSVADIEAWRIGNHRESDLINVDKLTSSEWTFFVGGRSPVHERLSNVPLRLSDVASAIFQGLVTSADPIYLLDPGEGRSKRGFVAVKSRATGKNYILESGVVVPLCKGARDVRRYSAIPSKRVLFPYDSKASAQTGKTVIIPAKSFEENFPNSWRYLLENYESLRNRERGKMRNERWYGFVYPKSVALFGRKKILTPSIAAMASFTLDQDGSLYFVGSGGGGGGGYGIIIKEGVAISYEYLLGLLNSRLLDYFVKSHSSRFSGGYYAYSRQYIEKVPIRIPEAGIPRHMEIASSIEDHVRKLLRLHQVGPSAPQSGNDDSQLRIIQSTDKQIDALVYELYGLTEEEIKIVEGAVG